ncbi:Beta-eudesmol synthase [Platanthera guangdongensis]|uniref:Beta-eudesmol synthase n=1 Tax=Platanthera guangdongensis TaxID=2320717 RepID=A0ABR2MGN3_9ASPA
MFKDASRDHMQVMEFIDTIQRLGIAYHFEKEISETLCEIHKTNFCDNIHDLHSVSLYFRLLRQQRYHVSSDVFLKFLDEEGEFEASLSTNEQAMISLYEAAHLLMSDEEVLEKAINFTKLHLRSRKLELPLIKRVDRPKTKSYLATYERDENCKGLLLDFAKMDFIYLQAIHQAEAQQLQNVAKGYLQEAIWANKSYVPKLEEHLNVSLITAGYSFLTCASYIGMKEVIPKEIFDWVTSFPEIIRSSCVIGRLMNDIVTYELEQKRDHVASTVQCYVVEHGCSEEEACEELTKMVENAWRVINKEIIMETDIIPASLIWPAFNLARFNAFVYEGNDIYTNADKIMKDNINTVLVESVLILLASSTPCEKFEVAKFDGEHNFGLWQVKIKALLIKEGRVVPKEEGSSPSAGGGAGGVLYHWVRRPLAAKSGGAAGKCGSGGTRKNREFLCLKLAATVGGAWPPDHHRREARPPAHRPGVDRCIGTRHVTIRGLTTVLHTSTTLARCDAHILDFRQTDSDSTSVSGVGLMWSIRSQWKSSQSILATIGRVVPKEEGSSHSDGGGAGGVLYHWGRQPLAAESSGAAEKCGSSDTRKNIEFLCLKPAAAAGGAWLPDHRRREA